MRLCKDIPMTVALHGAVWSLPLATGGVQNLLAVVVWGCALMMVFAAFAALAGVNPNHSMPAWWSWTTRASFYGSMAWLIYHGHIAAGSVMLFAALAILLARKAHADNATESS